MESQFLDESWCVVVVVTPAGVDKLSLTLESVQANSLGSRLSILAYESPDIRRQLAHNTLPVDYSLPSAIDQHNQWASICSHYNFTSRRTLFVLAGTVVPQHWDARLVAAGQCAHGAAAVAPLCARHPVFSVFSSATHSPGLPVDDIDQWLNDYVEGIEFTVPVLLASCLLLQGDFWRGEHCRVESDQELLHALRNHGQSLVATDRVYVDDSKAAYDNTIGFLPEAYQSAYIVRHPLRSIQHALTELSKRQERPAKRVDCLPVQLHIGHSWGGGLGRWMEDYIAADTSHNHLVLRSIGDINAFGQAIALYRSMDMGLPVRKWTLSEPVTAMSLGNPEYRQIIEELIAQYSVETLVISSLIGHSLDWLRTALPTTVVFHDFFPFCPALYATFGSPCHSCTESDLRACSRENPIHSFFKWDSDDYWMAARLRFVDLIMQENVTLVAPSESVMQRYCSLVPRLQQKQIHIVPHGLSTTLASSLVPASSPAEARERLRLVILGRLTEEKGWAIVNDIIKELTGFADVLLLGVGESGQSFKSIPEVTVVDSFHSDELGGLLNQYSPDLGLLLSVVPETFSYTLSELWAAGIPVLATRLGAFVDRVKEGDNGWLVEPAPAAVLAQLEVLLNQRDLLQQARQRLLVRTVRTADTMVDAYVALEPEPEMIPLNRYKLARRSYGNPYARSGADKQGKALHVNHQLPYRKVLADFLDYTGRKVGQTPSLPPGLRGGIGRLLCKFAGRIGGK